MSQFNDIVAGSLDIAQTEAMNRRTPSLEPVHLLHGLLTNPSSKSHKLMKPIKAKIDKLLQELPVLDKKNFNPSSIKPSPQFSRWITLSSSRAIQSGRQEIEEDDLLNFLPEFFPSLDLSSLATGSDEEAEAPVFLVNLNDLAKQGKLDPVIGRTKEIRAVMEILGRRRKNNPVLVGDAGVGKTAVVEGLADLVVKGTVPDALKDKVIYSLDMGALMAGTKFRGEFEERMQKLLKFIKDSSGKVILFIDELHQLVGAGKTDGAMDAANLLKPALARGELHCIGATTYDEYRRYILADSALDRRFRPVPIGEPSIEDSVEIMMGLKEKLEIHHGVEISDEAIFSSVFLSKQYIPDKNLPDKAIDLIDEAASSLKLSAEAMPPQLVELEAEIRSKLIYSKTEHADPKLKDEIKQLQERYAEGKKKWDQDVLAIKRVSELKNRLERLKFDLEKAQATQNFEEASRIKYAQIPEVEAELAKSQNPWKLMKKDVAQVISRQTAIPVEKILKSKQENILELESYLKMRVFGQDEAVHEIADTLVSAHAGLTDQSRPLGSFLLLGPSGVGKTETAKAICKYLFDSEDNLIRLDLSEYSEKHSVAKLIGAPAGYVGYEDGGALTEAVRRKPYSVILFDEVEKAHPDFADILLQILDDGRLTDNKGRTISFRNTILILTSNSKSFEQDFKPEVLGRLDAVLHYKTLNEGIMSQLIDRQLEFLNDNLKSRNVNVELDHKVIEELATRGYDPRYGARPLKTVFAKLVTRPLSRILLKDQLENATLKGVIQDGLVTFSKA